MYNTIIQSVIAEINCSNMSCYYLEKSQRCRLLCYAQMLFHPNAPTCHSGVFALVILKGAGLNPNAFDVFTAIMSSADRVRRVSAEFIIALNTPKTSGLSPALF